jgi:hypothetical protein
LARTLCRLCRGIWAWNASSRCITDSGKVGGWRLQGFRRSQVAGRAAFGVSRCQKRLKSGSSKSVNSGELVWVPIAPLPPKPTDEANRCILRYVTPKTLQKAPYVGSSQIPQPPQVVCFCLSQFPFPEPPLAGDDPPAVPPMNAKVRPVHRPNLAGVGQLTHAHQASISEVFSRRSLIRKRTKRRTVALSAPPWPGKQPTPAPSSQGLDTATPSGSHDAGSE